MDRSDTIKDIATALAKAQGDFVGAVKDSINPHFKSKYADLESVVAAIKPALSKHGLSFVQVSHDAQNAASIETIILHSSGEWLSAGVVAVPVCKNDAQGFGSAMTYARRYSLSAAFGIAPEDDDGNAAAKSPAKTEQPKDFTAEIEKLRACGSIAALSIAWSKLDKPTQHALAAIKDECKNRILAADKEAALEVAIRNMESDIPQ